MLGDVTDHDVLAIVLDVDRWDRATNDARARAVAAIARRLGPAFALLGIEAFAGHQWHLRTVRCTACDGMSGNPPQSGNTDNPDCDTCNNRHTIDVPYQAAPLAHRVACFRHTTAGDFVLVPGRLDVVPCLLGRAPRAGDDTAPPTSPFRTMTPAERRHACTRGGSFDLGFDVGTWPAGHPLGLHAAEEARRLAVDIPGLAAVQDAASDALATELGPIQPYVPPGCLLRTGHGTADPPAALTALAFSRDGRWLATGGRGEIRIWDAANGRQLSRLALAHPREDVATLAFAPDHLRLVAATRADVEIFEVATGESLVRLGAGLPASRMGPYYCQYRAAAWLPGGAVLVAEATLDGNHAHLWLADPDSGTLLHATDWKFAHSLWDLGLATSWDGSLAASSLANDGAIVIWDVTRWVVATRVPVERASTIALGPDCLFTTTRDEVRVHVLADDPAPGVLLGTTAMGVIAAAPDGRRVAWQGPGVGFIDRATRRRITVSPEGHAPFAFSPDGTRLATAIARQTFAAIWELRVPPRTRRTGK